MDRTALIAVLLLSGCGPDFDQTIRMDAFAPDGTHRSSVDPSELADAKRRRLIIAYQQG